MDSRARAVIIALNVRRARSARELSLGAVLGSFVSTSGTAAVKTFPPDWAMGFAPRIARAIKLGRHSDLHPEIQPLITLIALIQTDCLRVFAIHGVRLVLETSTGSISNQTDAISDLKSVEICVISGYNHCFPLT